MKTLLFSLLGIVVIFIIVFSLNVLGLVSFRFFAPKYENARREVYENTQSYIEAKRQAITKYYNEYRQATSVDKHSIRSIVLQEFANFDTDKLTSKQQEWYNEITK